MNHGDVVARPRRMGDLIAARRHGAFVGRRPELSLFRSLLSRQSPVRILYVHGPGGVGKTALLAEYARVAVARRAQAVTLDGRDIVPTPEGFLDALRHACRTGGDDDRGTPLDQLPQPVVLVDGVEQLAPLDRWIRDIFVPQLPERGRLVLAGRSLPPSAWRSDAGLGGLCRVIALRNFTPHEGRAYLARRGVPAARRGRLLAATYGHPLALALLSDQPAATGTAGDDVLNGQPDVVQALVERCLAAAPTARHRDALVVCALARVTPEELLADVLGLDDARDLFDWLRRLSGIEQSPEGLSPHDLSRDVIIADFRWRQPDRYRDLQRRIRDATLRRLTTAPDASHQRLVLDKLFLHKRSPLMRPYFDFAVLEGVHVEPAAAADRPAILQILREHEGQASSAIAARWLDRQPSAFQVWRTPDGRLRGLMAHLVFGEPTPEEVALDPALAGIWAHVRQAGGLRPGEVFLVHRFWADRDGYQDVPAQTIIAAAASLLWMTRPHLAWSFPCTAAPDRWAPMFAYCGFTREPALDFTVGPRSFGVFAHDWRREPPYSWLDAVLDREAAGPASPSPSGAMARLVLSRHDFDRAVRQALRDYLRADALATNPLARSRLVGNAAGGMQAAEALRTLLLDAVESLQRHPRDHRLYRAVWHACIQPAGSQELAAERLGVPFSTFRYQLNGALARISDWLWALEVAR